jgi:hypothetical protein
VSRNTGIVALSHTEWEKQNVSQATFHNAASL